MLIKDILKYNLITCNIDKEIKDICILMKENNLGFIPINDGKDIIGVVTDRDIVIRGIASSFNDIKNIMSSNIISIDSSKELKDALKYFEKHKIKRLLVTENDEYVGVLSISDILKSEYNEKEIIKTIKNIFSEDIETNNFEVDSFYL